MAEYPKLRPSEIVGCLKDCGLQLVESDLTNPTKEKMQEVYYTLCTILTGDSLDGLEEMQVRAAEHLEPKKLYTDAVAEVALYRSLEKLVKAAGIPNFSLQRDLFHPEGRRTTAVLSGIINFAKFRQSKLSVFANLTEGADQLIASRQTEQENHERLQRELSDICDKRAAEEPILEGLLAEKQTRKEEVDKLNVEQLKIREECENIRVTVNQPLKQKIKDTEFLCNNITTEIEKLQRGIVDNPDLMRKRIQEAALNVDREKKSISDLEKQCREVGAKTQQMSRLDKEVDKCLELMQSSVTEMEKSKAASKEKKELKQGLTQAEQKRQDLLAQKSLLQKQIANSAERKTAFQAKKEEKTAQAKKALELARAEHEAAVKRGNTETHNQIEANLREAKQNTLEAERERENHNANVKCLTTRFNELQTQLERYHERILIGMEVTEN